MLFEAIVLALIAGLIFKGKPANLKTVKIRYTWLIFGGLIIRYLPKLLDLQVMDFVHIETEQAAPVFFIASYALLILGCALNMDQWEMIVVLSGVSLNLIVIAINGGYMPVSREILETSGYPLSKLADNRIDMNHILTDTRTKLRFLADIIPLTKIYPMKKIISIGDILMSTGVFILIFRRLRGKPERRSINSREE